MPIEDSPDVLGRLHRRRAVSQVEEGGQRQCKEAAEIVAKETVRVALWRERSWAVAAEAADREK